MTKTIIKLCVLRVHTWWQWHRILMLSAYFFMSSKMGCIVTNVTVRTWPKKKKHIVIVKCERTLTSKKNKISSISKFQPTTNLTKSKYTTCTHCSVICPLYDKKRKVCQCHTLCCQRLSEEQKCFTNSFEQ